MAPTLRTLLDRLAGPAPALPALLDRAAERWVAAPVRARILVAAIVATVPVVGVAGLGEPSIAVTVAAADLPAGAGLDRADLALRRLPRSLVPADAVADPDDVTGATLRHPVAAGQPLLRRSLVTGLEALLGVDQVAMRVPTELLPGLEAGQRVDILGTDAAGGTGVLAAGARVLRVDTDGAWVQVDRNAAAGIGHAIAWGGLTIALLAPSPPVP